MITSPVVLGGKVELVQEIDLQRILNSYKSNFGIDVSRFFKDLDKLELYKCESTGYRFFSPVDGILGDSTFYEQLQTVPWYYSSWRWEYDVFMDILSPHDKKILEVGSGGLSFMERIQSLGYNIIGLELNEQSIQKAKEKGLNVQPVFLESFASENVEQFDIVCAFQVFEHIRNIREFVTASLKTLKVGGKLFISVPNLDSIYMQEVENHQYLLNYPPHHAGWWTTEAFHALSRFFPLRLVDVKYEPLKDYQINKIMAQFPRKQVNRIPGVRGLLYRLLHAKLKKRKKSPDKVYAGHSIAVVYEKI